MSSSNKIVLTSLDDQSFEVDEVVAREFAIVSNMIDDDCADKAIPLSNVTGKILAMAIEYCKKHVEINSKEKDEEEKKKELVSLDADFKKDKDMETLIQLLLAANYLNSKNLLELICQTIADSIKDKTPEEIRDTFNIENDFTPEEEEAIRKENAWAFE